MNANLEVIKSFANSYKPLFAADLKKRGILIGGDVKLPLVNVPKFEGAEYGSNLEAAIIFNLISALAHSGFTLVGGHDGEENTLFDNAKEAAELVFSVGISSLSFKNSAGRPHWIQFVVGNGIDIISDYGSPRISTGFAEAVDAFSSEENLERIEKAVAL